MAHISVCKNVIAANNKRGWVDPDPAIRVSRTASGKATTRAHKIGILDALGNIVAVIDSTKDGKPILKCGAKVAIETHHDVVILD